MLNLSQWGCEAYMPLIAYIPLYRYHIVIYTLMIHEAFILCSTPISMWYLLVRMRSPGMVSVYIGSELHISSIYMYNIHNTPQYDRAIAVSHICNKYGRKCNTVPSLLFLYSYMPLCIYSIPYYMTK